MSERERLILVSLISAATLFLGCSGESHSSAINDKNNNNFDYGAVFRVQGNVFPDGYIFFFHNLAFFLVYYFSV